MISLNTAFKKVYGELLEPYGFKKAKGRNPYFVRMVGDEIVHVITCIPRQGILRGEKFFDILAGVATVYRGRLNLDESVSNNINWMNSIIGFYRKTPDFKGNKDTFERWYMFPYDGNNEQSLISSLKYTTELVKYIILPILDRTYNLKACYENFVNYGVITRLNKNEYELEKTYEDNEGLICTKLFDEKNFILKRKAELEKVKKDDMFFVNDVRCRYSLEDHERKMKMYYKNMLEEFEIYKSLISDKSSLVELFRVRKDKNLGILQKCGIDVNYSNMERLSSMKHPDKIIIPDELL